MRVIAFGLVAAFAAASSSHAADWGTVATISSTLGANANRLCLGEGTRATDIGCPSYAPYVSATTGGVAINGNDSNLTTSKLYVGGNLVVSGGAINSSGGYYLGGGWSAYMGGSSSSNYLTFGTSSTEAVRIVSSGYVGIGTSAPVGPLHVKLGTGSGVALGGYNPSVYIDSDGGDARYSSFAVASNVGGLFFRAANNGSVLVGAFPAGYQSSVALEVSGTISATNFVGNGSGLTGVVASSGDRITSGTTSFIVISNTGYISLTQASTNTGWFDPTRGLVTLGVSATGRISATGGYFGGAVTVNGGNLNLWSANIVPNCNGCGTVGTSTAQFGSVYAANLVAPTGSNLTLQSSIGGAQGQIVGNIYLTAPNNSGPAGYGANGGSVIFTSGLSSNSLPGYFQFRNGNVGMGFTTTPTTALEVSGTVSATNFVGNGSGLTGVTASSGDRIASGTTLLVVNGNTSFVSLTQAGTNTGWFDPTYGLVTIGVSSTGPISGTSLYASGDVNVAGYIYGSKNVQAANNVYVGNGFYFGFGNSIGTSIQGATNAKYMIFNVSSTEAMRIVSSGYVGIGTSAPTAQVEISSTGISTTDIFKARGVIGNIYADYTGARLIFTRAGVNYIAVSDTSGVGSLAILTSGTNLSTYFNPAGYVGMGGINTPNAQLDVSGTVSATRFVGDGSGLSGISTQGDRITSGTLVAVANSATGYISLSTNGATWGYLSSGNNYLPTLNTSTISATVISATAIQLVSQSTGPVICNSGNSGSLRYNSPTTTLELCIGTGWVPMGVGIPAGTISAFASTTCPAGWSEYTAARGRFLRGIDNGAGVDPDGTRSPGATQADMVGPHTHGMTGNLYDSISAGNGWRPGVGAGLTWGTGTYYSGVDLTSANQVFAISSNGTAESRPKNVALTFCQFNGTSNGWNNPLSGGSTTPGGNSTNIQYNGGGSFAGSDNFAWANGTNTVSVTGTVSATYGYFKYISATNGGLGVSALASLTDVSVSTSPMSGGILTYASGKWQAVSPSQILSTTTMVPNWPDAISCTPTSWGAPVIFYFIYKNFSGKADYRYINIGSTTYDIQFDSNTQVHTGNVGFTPANTTDDCDGKSIAQLYASGQAFNFIGGSGASSSTALGDRITSGTLVAVANSATGYISLTTGASTWGYFGSAASYLPNVSTTNSQVSNLLTFGGQAITSLVGGGGNYIVSGTTSVSVTNASSGAIKFATNGSQRMVIDSSGNVGINLITPSYPLTISGNIVAGPGSTAGPAYMFYPTGTYGATGMYAPAANAVGIVTSGSERMRIDSSGNVAIGTSSASAGGLLTLRSATAGAGYPQLVLLAGSKTWRITNDGGSFVVDDGTGGAFGSGVWVANGGSSWSALSDRRLKKDLETIEDPIAKLSRIRGVTFYWKDPKRTAAQQVGVIAQDVEAAFPQLVTKLNGYEGVNYAGLVAPLIEAVKELKANNDNLQHQVDELRREMREMNQRKSAM